MKINSISISLCQSSSGQSCIYLRECPSSLVELRYHSIKPSMCILSYLVKLITLRKLYPID